EAKLGAVQYISNTPQTRQYADVVLHAAACAEKADTMTNADRRTRYVNKLAGAPGEALPYADIICRVAKKMGFNGFDYKNFAEIYAEHCALTAGTNIDISGLSYDILKEERSVQWPYPENTTGNGTARLFTDKKFYTPTKKAIIHS